MARRGQGAGKTRKERHTRIRHAHAHARCVCQCARVGASVLHVDTFGCSLFHVAFAVRATPCDPDTATFGLEPSSPRSDCSVFVLCAR